MKDVLNIIGLSLVTIFMGCFVAYLEFGYISYEILIVYLDVFPFYFPLIVIYYFYKKFSCHKDYIELDNKKPKHVLKDSVERHSYKPSKKRK